MPFLWRPKNEKQKVANDALALVILAKLKEHRLAGLLGEEKDDAILRSLGDYIASVPSEDRGEYVRAILTNFSFESDDETLAKLDGLGIGNLLK